MAISFISAATGTNTATLGTHASGDYIIGFAYRDGNATAPTVPAGQNWTTIGSASGANSNSSVMVYKVAASSSETTGTFTNGTSVVFLVYRGVSGIGGNGSTGGNSTTVTYPTVSMTRADGTSWVVGFAGHRSVDTSLENAPSGMSNRANTVDATDEASGHDTAGGVSSWSDTNVSVGGTSLGWRARTVELLAKDRPITAATTSFTITGRAATLSKGRVPLTAANGSFTLTGNAVTLSNPGGGTWTASINCRDTSGYVTDGSGETYCTGDDDIYPTPRNGLEFGWDGNVSDMGRNRDSALDRRLAGTNQVVNSGTQSTFTLKLRRTGNHSIRIANGDGTTAQGYQYLQVLDDSTPLFTIDDNNGTSGASFNDANGTEYSAANWPGSNSLRNITLTSTLLRIKLGTSTAQSGSSTLAHVFVTEAAAGNTMSAGSGTFTLTAGTTNFGVKMPADNATFTITGNAAALSHGYPITAASGTFALTGQDTTLLWKQILSAVSGTFALTPGATNLAVAMPAASGTFTLTGNAVNFDVKTPAAFGTFNITGPDANLLWKQVVGADSGVFTLTGNSVTLTKTGALSILADAGAFSLSGQTANLLWNQKIVADAATFALTGQPSELLWKQLITADSGVFTLTGRDAALSVGSGLVHYSISAGGGVFTEVGYDISIIIAALPFEFDAIIRVQEPPQPAFVIGSQVPSLRLRNTPEINIQIPADSEEGFVSLDTQEVTSSVTENVPLNQVFTFPSG